MKPFPLKVKRDQPDYDLFVKTNTEFKLCFFLPTYSNAKNCFVYAGSRSGVFKTAIGKIATKHFLDREVAILFVLVIDGKEVPYRYSTSFLFVESHNQTYVDWNE